MSTGTRQAKLEHELARELGRCIADFDLISDGDRIMVCMSGGKDSYTMLHLLERARRKAPIRFSLLAVHLDQGHPGYDGSKLAGWLEAHGFEFRILSEDTYSVVKANVAEGKTYCSLCSRLRRGVLYNAAVELGCSKIALGHHRDDAIETLLLNLMFSGQLKSMPPKLLSDDGRNIVIRPLLYSAESTIAELAELMQFPILPCDLCGSQDNLKRKQVKNLLTALEQSAPRAKESMLAALSNVRPSHLFDAGLWQKLGLHTQPESGDALGDALGDAGSLAYAPESPHGSRPAAPNKGRSLRVL
jgi:tRNA 2-thiocytidine biosynthesis protein TtcA